MVVWTPKEESTAEEAISNVLGDVDAYPVEVTNDQAKEIREKYEELTDED